MKKKMNKEFVVYCPEADELVVFENQFNLNYDIAMLILSFGLNEKYTLAFIGELWKRLKHCWMD